MWDHREYAKVFNECVITFCTGRTDLGVTTRRSLDLRTACAGMNCQSYGKRHLLLTTIIITITTVLIDKPYGSLSVLESLIRVKNYVQDFLTVTNKY